MHHRKPLPAFPSAPDTASERIAYVEELMRTLQWERGKTGPALARAWGYSEVAVSKWASEAWRRVKVDIEDPENAARTKLKITDALEFVVDDAVDELRSRAADNPNDTRRSVIAASKAWAELEDIVAAVKHRVEVAPAAMSADELRRQAVEAMKVLAAEDPELIAALATELAGSGE